MLHSEIVLPGSALDLDYALDDLPAGIAALTHELAQTRGRATVEEFATFDVVGACRECDRLLGPAAGVPHVGDAARGGGGVRPRRLRARDQQWTTADDEPGGPGEFTT
jgi:hypothetical protein